MEPFPSFSLSLDSLAFFSVMNIEIHRDSKLASIVSSVFCLVPASRGWTAVMPMNLLEPKITIEFSFLNLFFIEFQLFGALWRWFLLTVLVGLVTPCQT